MRFLGGVKTAHEVGGPLALLILTAAIFGCSVVGDGEAVSLSDPGLTSVTGCVECIDCVDVAKRSVPVFPVVESVLSPIFGESEEEHWAKKLFDASVRDSGGNEVTKKCCKGDDSACPYVFKGRASPADCLGETIPCYYVPWEDFWDLEID